MSHAISVCHGAFGRATVYELDKVIVTHAHREGHLIFYVGGSKASVLVGDQACPINADHCVAVSPWEPHSFQIAEHDRACLCLTLYIKPIWFLENSPSPHLALNFGMPTVPLDCEIARWSTRLTAMLLEDSGTEAVDAMLLEITRRCFEKSWEGVEQSAQLERTCGRFSDFRVRRSLQLMQENYAEEVEMRHLARDVGLSRPHFFKLFKRQMGVTPNVYLNTLRAERAIEDLLRTSKTVTDIAYDLGFSSQGSFTRFFASNVGIAPSDYRRVAQFA